MLESWRCRSARPGRPAIAQGKRPDPKGARIRGQGTHSVTRASTPQQPTSFLCVSDLVFWGLRLGFQSLGFWDLDGSSQLRSKVQRDLVTGTAFTGAVLLSCGERAVSFLRGIDENRPGRGFHGDGREPAIGAQSCPGLFHPLLVTMLGTLCVLSTMRRTGSIIHAITRYLFHSSLTVRVAAMAGTMSMPN